jgi:hypothetical protein
MQDGNTQTRELWIDEIKEWLALLSKSEYTKHL